MLLFHTYSILFVDTYTAVNMVENPSDKYRVEYNAFCPSSVKDFKDYIRTIQYSKRKSFIEYKGTIVEDYIQDSGIISVNRHIINTVYTPIRRSSEYTLLRQQCDVLEEDIGWDIPMSGITWRENRERMSVKAFNDFLMSDRIIHTMIDKYYADEFIVQDSEKRV